MLSVPIIKYYTPAITKIAVPKRKRKENKSKTTLN